MDLNNLPAIGTHIEADGGHFGGVVRVNDKLLGLIWAPKADGETTTAWLTTYTDVPGAQSCGNSITNTLALAEVGSPLAAWVTGLRIGGHDDWVIPARDVLELAYRHLKPTEEETGCYYRDGDNPSSVPPGFPYTDAHAHAQTSVEAFKAGGAEAFEADAYWSSTQYSDSYAWYQGFDNGDQYNDSKGAELRARAVRLIPVTP
jgi:hypothetical protein